MFSHRSLEGELLIDHRAGDGTAMVPAGRKFEAPTLTCCGCQKVMIVNPNRTRTREYCPQHDSYICDTCNLLRKLHGRHEGFAEFADRYLNAAAKGKELPKWPNAS